MMDLSVRCSLYLKRLAIGGEKACVFLIKRLQPFPPQISTLWYYYSLVAALRANSGIIVYLHCALKAP